MRSAGCRAVFCGRRWVNKRIPWSSPREGEARTTYGPARLMPDEEEEAAFFGGGGLDATLDRAGAGSAASWSRSFVQLVLNVEVKKGP